MAVDPEVLNAAVSRLVRALRGVDEPRQRAVPAWTVREQAVLTAELHEIAAAAHQHLHLAQQMQHPLYRWTVVYVSDGAHFVATAPS